MQNKYGVDRVDEMIENSKRIAKIQTSELLVLIDSYKLKVIELEKQLISQ